MASRFNKFRSFSRMFFGTTRLADPSRCAVGKQFVELENRAVPATFIVTNILDNQLDVVGGLSLRQAINAANGNPGFDRIEFNIPRSPSLPTLPNDPTESYFPIVLASTLPDLTDPAGVSIDATTQPRNNTLSTRPIVQLLPDPNPGAFPGQKGAFFISGPNNTLRGMVITGFPGAAINLAGANSHDNVIVGNWINTDITGTRSWNEDPFISSARPQNTPPELTNTGPLANQNPLFVLGGITLTNGAADNIIGGVIDEQAAPLADSGGRLIGTGGTISRYNSKGVLVDTGIPVDASLNRNIISGTPQFKKSYFNYTWALDGSTKVRQDDIAGAGVGPGIRIMDPGTDRNLIQGNFIGTGITGNEPIPNHNGIEIFNNATGNLIGNPTTKFVGDPVQAGIGNLIRFNENDGVRLGDTPNPSQIAPPPPNPGSPAQPYQEGEDFFTTTTPGAFGPISQSGRVGGVFFDSYNPNYFTGRSPTSTDILTVNRTTLDFTSADKTINIANAVTTPGINAQVGETITINGSGLLATTAVTFNASKTSVPNPQTVPAKFVIISDTELSVIVPAGALTPPPRVAPNADIPAINVFTPAGVARIADAVILPSPPAIIEIVSTFSPSSGLAGSKVSIFGSGFVGTQSITFGGIIATDFTVAAGGSRIDVIVPTGALSGPINIITPGGGTTTTRDFRVETQPPPIVSAINRTTALPGQEVILTGVNFTGAYLVRFNYTGGVSGFTTTDVIVDSSTQIRVKVPVLATASNGPIQVVTNDGFGVSLATLQITTPPAPTIASLSSTNGPLGSVITITGSNFTSANRVTFSGIDAQDFDILSANVIRAVVPFGLPIGTSSPVSVISSGGTATFGTPFTITPSLQPTVASIPFANRNTFTVINGTNLSGTTKVLFGDPIGGIPSTSVEVLSDSQLRVLIPSAVASTGSFYVFTAYHTQNPFEPPAENTYAVADTVLPVISEGRISDPISGIIGSTVTLRGSGFIGTQNVFFTKAGGGTIAATNLVIVNDREINFRVPLQATSGNITVSTLGVSDTLQPFDPAFPNTAQPNLPINTTSNLTPSTTGFTLLASPAPIIDGFFPASGPIGTFMTISGRNLAGAAQVKVGDGIVTDYVIESDNIIKFRVPQLATNGPVSIATPGGTAFSATSFNLTPSPIPVIDYSSPRVPRGAQVTIAGSGLAGTSKVVFNDVPAQFTIISDTLITAIVPVTAGPGEIRIFTPGGNVASPTPFTLSPLAAPFLLGAVNQDAAPVGSKITINTAANNVFRVEFAVPLSPPNSGTAATFTFGGGGLIVTVPELAPGDYEMRVFSSSNLNDGNYLGDPLSYWDSSYSEATNILGDTFVYGEKIQVLPAARARVDSVTTQDVDLFGANVDFFRGAPIAIRGNGFTGTNRIRFSTKADPLDNTGFFVDIAGSSGIGANAPVDPTFTVVSDNLIVMNLPITQFAGALAVPNINVFTFTPSGTPGDITDDLPSYQFDAGTGAKVFNAPVITIAATPAFTFDVVNDISGAPSGATVTITAKTGNFFAANNITFTGSTQTFNAATGIFSKGAQFAGGNLAQPFPVSDPTLTKLTSPIQNFQIVPGTGGTQVNIIMPTFAQATPATVVVTPPNTMNPLPAPPDAGLFQLTTVFNGGVTAKSDETAAPDKQFFFISPFKASGTISNVSKTPFNRVTTISGSAALVTATGVVIEVRDANGNLGTTSLNRNQFEAFLVPGGAQIQFVNPTLRNPFDPRQTTAVPTGNYVVVHNSGNNATGTVTPAAQTFPTIFQFAIPTDPPVDNRIVANRVFDNGLTIQRDATTGFVTGVTPKGQDTKFTDGNLGIDFITQGNPGSAFPFAWGYAHTQQGPPTSPFPAGNQGRGGLNDGKLADSFILSFPNNTFNNTQFGRFQGPNLLQNFPLLQVVQSSLDRTTFSTALLGKPFRSYRIDYYYNPGIENSLSDSQLDPFLAGQSSNFVGSRYDDQDKTARNTTNIGSGQIYLGSKVITTDAQGDGSVNFIVYKRLPTDPNDPTSIPPLQPGEFQLPDNQPLVPSTVDPATGNVTFRAGVVTSTATDLTAPGPDGPILSTGPDGTSRFSFFKRVDTPTGGIRGSVIIDKNANNIIDPGEGGLTDSTVSLFLQRDDGTYAVSPNDTRLISADGAYSFGITGGGSLGLSNGKHKLVLTLPTGGTTTYFYETPPNGILFNEIISGETDTNANFLVTTAPVGNPPTITDIANQNVAPGTVVGPLAFTIADVETPADQLTITVSSSNLGFVPLSNIVLGGSGSNRTITVILPPGVVDSSIITVTVTDGNGLSALDQFVVNTGAVVGNTPPTITPIANQNGQQNIPLGPIAFTVGDAETPVGSLIVTVQTSNSAAVPLSAIVLGGSGADRTITITPPANAIGTSAITVIVTDLGGLSSQTVFTVDVPPATGTAPNLLVIGSDAGRTGQVNVYNPNGTFRYTLTPYGDDFTGGVRVATGDVTGDGNADIITAPGAGTNGLVKIFDGVSGTFIQQFLPYGDFKGGVYVVTGDVDGDGIRDIVTGTGKGGGPRVRVLRGGLQGGTTLTLESIADFFPYESAFRGGVLVSAGDVNGDGFADIATGTGPGGGPRVRVVDGTNLSSTPGVGTLYDFFAYDNRVRSGVFATIGDVDNDGSPEIITGPGGAGPAVKIFKQSDISVGAPTFDVNGSQQFLASKSFFAYDPTNYNGGVRVDVIDGNGDGIADIVTGPGRGIGPDVRVINYATLQDIYRIQAFEASFNGGVYVGGNLD